MSASTASSGGRDEKIVNLLTRTLQKLVDFKERTADARAYAAQLAAAVRANNDTDAEFKDQIMTIVANIANLNGEIGLGQEGVSASELAVMDANAMRSVQQRRELAAKFRKRAREQTNVEKTSLHCTKCGLVRRDRLNINELALDSEESGSHFDYNFDNVCTCSHSSDEESRSSSEDGAEGPPRRRSASHSTSDSD